MESPNKPRDFKEWRNNSFERAEDAANTFGSHLIKYCRDEVVHDLPEETSENEKEKITIAIHTALHNMMDLLEGFWKFNSGEDHSVEYILQVLIKDKNQKEVERIDISPSKLDLPIGFWKWAEVGEFR
jgi:hypothetical protein